MVFLPKKGCHCDPCQKWKSLGLPLGIEMSSASPAPSPGLPPSAKPQRICRPLDLRKGAEIHLTEEEAQLAMSPVPAAGAGSLDQGGSWGKYIVTSPQMKLAFEALCEPKLPSTPAPMYLGKPLTQVVYNATKAKVDNWKKSGANLQTIVYWGGAGPVTRGEYISMFQQYEQAWLALQGQPQAALSNQPPSDGKDVV
jgi:hypothetical protein